jgi:c-di-GMP-binding flagellar brake protein YcgR
MSQEQRKHARYAVEVAAEVEIRGETVVASTTNVSSGGVGVLLDRSVQEGATVGVLLFLTQDGIEDPDEEPFESKAQVMWTAEQGEGRFAAGLRFTSLGPDQRKLLDRFLSVLDER